MNGYLLKRAGLLAVAGMVGLAAGCKKEAAKPAPVQATANLHVSTVGMERTQDALELPARVEVDPRAMVHLYAPVSGRLLNMTLSPGMEVRKGQTVAMVQSGDVAQARADFDKAKIEVLRADRALERGKLLAAHEVLSQADLQELQAVDDAAHAEQARTRTRIHELGFSENGTSDVTPIVAPISGTVLEIGTATGEMQRSLETSNGLATIANLDTVWVTGDLYEQDLGLAKLHAPVEITFAAYPGQVFHGTIANVGDSLDPATHAVKVRAVLANPNHALKPAMYATMRIERPAATRILLPQAAVLHEGNGTLVYMPAAGGKYVTRQVTVGATVGDKVEIVSGLRPGEQVVTEGAAFLREPVGD